MKKIKCILIAVLLICLTLINLFRINVSASSLNTLKKLIIIKGTTDVLDYPGYSLIETNVNYNEEGIYYAEYKDDLTKKMYTREIEIISKESINQFGLKNVNEAEQFTFEDYTIIKRVYTSKIDIFLVSDGESYYLYVTDQINFAYKKIGKQETLKIVDIYFDSFSKLIYILGNIQNDSLDIFISCFTVNCIKKGEQQYSGSKIDAITDYMITEDELYLVGYTTSNDKDFYHTSYKEDSFILSIDKKSLKIINYVNFGEYGIDKITNITLNDEIYITKLMYLNGIPVIKIAKLDKNLQEHQTTYLGTTSNITSINLQALNGNVYYFCSLFDKELKDTKTMLYEINKDLSIKLIDSYYDKYSTGVDFTVTKNELTLLYTSTNKDENYPTYLRVITKEPIKLKLGNKIYDYCYFNQDGNLDTVEKNTLKCYEYSLIHIESYGGSLSTEIIDPVIKFNNIEVNYNPALSIIDIDENLFGVYELLYYYNLEFFDLVYKKNVTVKEQINLSNNNKYQKGVTLYLSGLASIYKSDKEISITNSSYTFNEIGNYKIELYGKDSSIIYDIEIVDARYKKNSILTYQIPISNHEIENSCEDLNIFNNAVTINNNNQVEYDNQIWYIIIPIFTFLFTLSISFYIARRIK